MLDEVDGKIKESIPLKEFMRNPGKACKYLLRISDKTYPCPAGEHGVLEKDGIKLCDCSKKPIFSFKSYEYFIGDLDLYPKRSFAIGSEEIVVIVAFEGISGAGNNLPVLCVLSKGNKVYLHFFELFEFRKGDGGVFVIFKPFPNMPEGEYSLDFYIAGRLLFSEKLKLYKIAYGDLIKR